MAASSTEHMGYFTLFLDQLLALVADLWLWLVVGFLMAGVVIEFVSSKTIIRHFGDNSLSGLVKASLAGLIASTCSCGAIPMAVSLRQKGASTAVALTFLLATPWSGIPQFLVLSNFLGLVNTIVITVAAVSASLLTGMILSRLERKKIIEGPSQVNTVSVACACKEGETCSCHHGTDKTPHDRIRGVLIGAWTSFRDIGKYMVIGLVLSAALSAFVPHEIVGKFLGSGNSLFAILLAVPVSAVIELCSEGFSILSGQLYVMGASLGVVFVMLMVGVTTDITEISVVWGKFGKRSAVAYVLTSTVVAVVIAYMLNFVWLQYR